MYCINKIQPFFFIISIHGHFRSDLGLFEFDGKICEKQTIDHCAFGHDFTISFQNFPGGQNVDNYYDFGDNIWKVITKKKKKK